MGLAEGRWGWRVSETPELLPSSGPGWRQTFGKYLSGERGRGGDVFWNMVTSIKTPNQLFLSLFLLKERTVIAEYVPWA